MLMYADVSQDQVAQEIRERLERARNSINEIALIIGDEWPEPFNEALSSAQEALNVLEQEFVVSL